MEGKASDWRPGPTVCRCCLSEGCYKDISTEYFWMGKREVYEEMLTETLNISISFSKSGGPNSNSRLICEPCIARLRDATEFKRQVIDCEKTFMHHLDPGSSSSRVTVQTIGDVKVELVKREKDTSDDDFDDRPDFLDVDSDDDLDNQPLTKLASKVPKKEAVDILDLLDNSQITVKRKATLKIKEAPPKKLKKKEVVVKPSASKPAPAKKPTEKKKGQIGSSINHSLNEDEENDCLIVEQEVRNDNTPLNDIVEDDCFIVESTDNTMKNVDENYCLIVETRAGTNNAILNEVQEDDSSTNDALNETVESDFSNGDKLYQVEEICPFLNDSLNEVDENDAFINETCNYVEENYYFSDDPLNEIEENDSCTNGVLNEAEENNTFINALHEDNDSDILSEVEENDCLREKLRACTKDILQGVECFVRLERLQILPLAFTSSKQVEKSASLEVKPKRKRNKKHSERMLTRKAIKRNTTSLLECWSLRPFRWITNKFKCCYCEAIFVDTDALLSHVKICSTQHEVSVIYKKMSGISGVPLINVDVTDAVCNYCSIPFTDIVQMREHVIQHGLEFDTSYSDGVLPFSLDKESWKCALCEEKYTNFVKLYKHMNTHYRDYICATCGKAFMTWARLKRHSRMHVTGKFPCSVCKRIFTQRTARNSHKSNAHPKHTFKCPHCDESFYNTSHRMIHLRDVHGKKGVLDTINPLKIVCKKDSLNEKSKTSWSLGSAVRFGMKTNASSILKCWSVSPFRKGTNKYKCYFCEDDFSESQDLRNHVKICSNQPEVKDIYKMLKISSLINVDTIEAVCNYCSTPYTNVAEMREHVIQHGLEFDASHPDGVVPFRLNEAMRCAICDKQFKTFSILHRHMNSHYQYFTCETCGATFMCGNRLTRHNKVHKLGNFPCPACKKVFSTRSKWDSHRAKCYRKKTLFSCPICEELFNNHNLRIAHMKQVHSTEIEHNNCKTMDSVAENESINHKCILEGNTGAVTLDGIKKNVSSILQCWTFIPFGSYINTLKCAYCEATFADCITLRDHIRLCSNRHDAKALFGTKKKEFQLIKVETKGAICNYCFTTFTHVAQIREHVIQHGLEFDTNHPDGVLPFRLDNDSWKCIICEEEFKNFFLLSKHMNVHYQNYICDVCGFGCTTASLLRNHHNKLHLLGTFPCSVCNRVFTTRSLRNTHKKSHVRNCSYKCPECEDLFDTYQDRAIHMKMIHSNKEKVLDDCNTLMNSKEITPRMVESRSRHVVKNNSSSILQCWTLRPFRWNQNKFLCAYCEENFIDCKALRDHVSLCSSQHEINSIFSKFIEMPYINADTTDAVCNYCSAPFADLIQMREHVIQHGLVFDTSYPDGVVPFSLDDSWKCVLCAERFNNFIKLYRHMNTHYQHYHCDTCGKAFMTLYRMRNHLKIHTLGTFSCPDCDKVFPTQAKKDSHRRTPCRDSTRRTHYKCPRCDERFNYYNARITHLVEVHGEKNELYEKFKKVKEGKPKEIQKCTKKSRVAKKTPVETHLVLVSEVTMPLDGNGDHQDFVDYEY